MIVAVVWFAWRLRDASLHLATGSIEDCRDSEGSTSIHKAVWSRWGLVSLVGLGAQSI